MAFKINKWQKFLTESKEKIAFKSLLDTGEFEQAFALADALGIPTQDLPWDLTSVSRYLDWQGYKDFPEGGFGLPAIRKELIKATGWTIEQWKEELAKREEELEARWEAEGWIVEVEVPDQKYLFSINESFAPLMQSNDLDAINQAIDLAISMEEFPEPDKVKYVVGQSGPEWGRIYVQYEGKNSPAGDIFEEWIKQYITPRSERIRDGWADTGEDVWYSRFESDNRGGRSVFTFQLPDQARKRVISSL
jgi:hypothetical protein